MMFVREVIDRRLSLLEKNANCEQEKDVLSYEVGAHRLRGPSEVLTSILLQAM